MKHKIILILLFAVVMVSVVGGISKYTSQKESDAIKKVGSVQEIANQILSEVCVEKNEKSDDKKVEPDKKENAEQVSEKVLEIVKELSKKAKNAFDIGEIAHEQITITYFYFKCLFQLYNHFYKS